MRQELRGPPGHTARWDELFGEGNGFFIVLLNGCRLTKITV